MRQPPRSRASAAVAVDGPALRELRKDRGLTVEQLATRIGVGKAYISKLELGWSPRCSVAVHAALLKALRPEHRDALRADRKAA